MAASLLSAQLSAVAAALGTGSGRDTSPARAGPSAATVIPHRRAASLTRAGPCRTHGKDIEGTQGQIVLHLPVVGFGTFLQSIWH